MCNFTAEPLLFCEELALWQVRQILYCLKTRTFCLTNKEIDMLTALHLHLSTCLSLLGVAQGVVQTGSWWVWPFRQPNKLGREHEGFHNSTAYVRCRSQFSVCCKYNCQWRRWTFKNETLVFNTRSLDSISGPWETLKGAGQVTIRMLCVSSSAVLQVLL